MPAPAMPPQLTRNILDATLGSESSKQGWRRWFSWSPAIWDARFAMGLGTVAASFLIVLHAAGGARNEPNKLDLNPVHMAHSANRQAHLTFARGAKFVSDLRVVYQIESQLRPQPEMEAPAPAVEQMERPAPKPEAKPEQEREPEPKAPPSTRDLDPGAGRQERTSARGRPDDPGDVPHQARK